MVALASVRLAEVLGSNIAKPESIPFSVDDVTAGSETELQAAVIGAATAVDLPLSIRSSNYFQNVVSRAATGEMPRRSLSRLERYLEDSGSVWENSWVRFPLACLGAHASSVLYHDLRADKSTQSTSYRQDVSRFRIVENGRELVRVPISYVVKLAWLMR